MMKKLTLLTFIGLTLFAFAQEKPAGYERKKLSVVGEYRERSHPYQFLGDLVHSLPGRNEKAQNDL